MALTSIVGDEGLEEGSFDGKNEQEKHAQEHPAADTYLFLATAQHDAEVGKKEDDHYEGDAYFPQLVLDQHSEAETEADKEGVDSSSDA